jgi:hypothetical protein
VGAAVVGDPVVGASLGALVVGARDGALVVGDPVVGAVVPLMRTEQAKSTSQLIKDLEVVMNRKG